MGVVEEEYSGQQKTLALKKVNVKKDQIFTVFIHPPPLDFSGPKSGLSKLESGHSG